MRIRGWLTGLITILLVPSLVFASLWFHNKFENFKAIDRSLTGLHLIQSLGPLMQDKALTGKVQDPPYFLRQAIAEFSKDNSSADLVENLDSFVAEPNIPLALRRARSVASSISQLAKLGSSTSYETSNLPQLINVSLLSVVIESSIMAKNAQDVAARSEINVWDKILIPVQGGQFKIAADNAAQDTSYYFRELKGASADALRQKALQYRKANLAYQSAGTKLLSSTITADRGAEIVSDPLIAAQPELVQATFALWQSAVDYLNEDLQHQRAQTLFALALAGLAGGLVILGAFAIAIALSRALAERTLKEFESLGFHDPLTALPNRRALLKTIRALPGTRADNRNGLIVIDLRHFKKINDRFGDHNGDSILREVAQQLIQVAGPDDFICRTGGTEFVLLRRGLADAAEFEQLAARIMQELGKERSIDGNRTALECNAGLFIGAPGVKLTDHILVDAGLALRSAKQKGPGKFDLFTHDMRTAFEVNGEIAKELLKALIEGDIVPWYQPQVDIHTGEIVGAEALVRWVGHDTVRYPGSFLPAAAESGYMDQIDKTVREKALRFAADLAGRTPRPIHLSLNVSSDLLSSARAVDALNSQVRAMGLSPSDVSLEILEAVMIDEVAATPIKENIARLSELGFFIELDDFGTGHSSISSLRDLKVDRVKIDRSFISGVDEDPDLQKFTSALINLAKSLDIRVLAEGVETEGERHWLKQNGCDVIQGFLISRAVPPEQLAVLILKQNFADPMRGHALQRASTNPGIQQVAARNALDR